MIAVNETGFLPNAVKLAISDKDGSFYIIDDNERKRLDIGVAVIESGFDETAGSDIYKLDFSGVSEPGIYHIESEDGEKSAVFKVEPHVYKTLKNSLLKFFYFQRCGCELPKKYAGPFERGACHLEAVRMLEEPCHKPEERSNNEENKDQYTEGEQDKADDSRVFIKKGWHDAGDFGRYSSAGAVAVAHMLYAYELFPEAFKELVNIPESGNGIPDILNECRYELEFLSEMQDEDGGVHHKVTSEVFCDFIMPEDDKSEQILFPVTSMATADFAAVMCVASRVYEEYDPAFARDCMHQAYLAGKWLIGHPENTDFHNPAGCNTGEYTDTCDLDERMWAFAELLRTDYEAKNEGDRSMMAAASQRETRQDRYLAQLYLAFDLYEKEHPHSDGRSADDGFGWQDVSSLAALAVIFDPMNRAGTELRDRMTDMLKERADAFVAMQEEGCPLAMEKQDFVWGSNMVVSNRADVLILTSLALRHRIELANKGIEASDTLNIKVIELSYHDKSEEDIGLTEDEISAMELDIEVYEEAALNQIHYILGMNAMDTSYVTGFGERAFKNPHNRVTFADNVTRPVPGEVSGGPCTLLADDEIKKTANENTPAQKCYVDHYMSYSTNEVTIYWNSSMLFATAYFDR